MYQSKNKFRLCLLLLAAGLCNLLFGQNNIPGVQTPCTTTAQGKAGNFVICYTIGEMPLIETAKSNGLMITQGIMQPFTFVIDTTAQCFTKSEVRIYPNPNNGRFSVQLNLLKRGKMQIQLFDALGRVLKTDAFDYLTFNIRPYDISNMASGNYFMQVLFTPEGKTDVQKCVYTIQKTN
jgi:hypothetical protein